MNLTEWAQENCDLKKSCQLNRRIGSLVDPCFEVQGYTRISFSCMFVEDLVEKVAHVCLKNDNGSPSCNAGKVIRIKEARSMKAINGGRCYTIQKEFCKFRNGCKIY